MVVDLVLSFPIRRRVWALKLWVPCDSAEISLETLEHNVIKPGSLRPSTVLMRDADVFQDSGHCEVWAFYRHVSNVFGLLASWSPLQILKGTKRTSWLTPCVLQILNEFE